MNDPGMGEALGASPAWFFVEDGKVVGPMTADELAACVRAGRVARETLVASSGSAAWISAGQIEGLLTAQRPPVPSEPPAAPAPPMHDLATSEAMEMEDDVATSDTLGDVVARSSRPRARSRSRAPAGDGQQAPRRLGLVLGTVGGLVAILIVAVFLLLRREGPAEPSADVEPSTAAPPASDVATGPSSAPLASAPTEPVQPAARTGVVATQPPATSPDAAAAPTDAAAAEIERLQAAYQAQVASFASAGGLDPSSLRTAADIDARLKQVAHLREENLAVERELLEIAQGLRSKLVAQGVPDAQAAALARTAQADLRITPLVQACRLDDEAWAASDDILGTLRGTLGHWQVRPDGDIEFDASVSPATYQNYAAAIERVKAAARGQQDLAAR